MEKYSTTQTMENSALRKLFWKLQTAVFLFENHHEHQHQTFSCADDCQAKCKAISIYRLSRFKISNKVKPGSMISHQGFQTFPGIFHFYTQFSGSLSHIFPLSKPTGSRVRSPKWGPICFSETARGKRGQSQMSQHRCSVWSNLLSQPLAPVTHLLAKAAGGSE